MRLLLVKSAAKLKYYMINAHSNVQDNVKSKLMVNKARNSQLKLKNLI